jgi:hypothetical protein
MIRHTDLGTLRHELLDASHDLHRQRLLYRLQIH